MKELLMGEQDFNEGNAGFSSIIEKKTWKNICEVFSTESKEQHQNLKQTEIITHMRGLPPCNTSLFTLAYF